MVQDCNFIQIAESEHDRILAKFIFVWQRQPCHQNLVKEGEEQGGNLFFTRMVDMVTYPVLDIKRSGERELLHYREQGLATGLVSIVFNSVCCVAPASWCLLDIIAVCSASTLAGRVGLRMFEDGQMYFMNAPFFGNGGR